MNETITASDTITLRIPLEIWAPAPMSRGVPRTHVESLYVRVATSGGVVGCIGHIFCFFEVANQTGGERAEAR
jgi:hypothetical protein